MGSGPTLGAAAPAAAFAGPGAADNGDALGESAPSAQAAAKALEHASRQRRDDLDFMTFPLGSQAAFGIDSISLLS